MASDFAAETGNERRNGRTAERRATEQNLRIASVGEKTTVAQRAETAKNAQDASFAERGEETREETRDATAARNAQNPQIRRWVSAARAGVVDDVGNKRRKRDERKEFDDLSDFDDLDDWDELDDDLFEIRSLIERKRARVEDEAAETPESNGSGTAKSGGDAARRREALDLVARNPERAAASLQRWLRPGA